MEGDDEGDGAQCLPEREKVSRGGGREGVRASEHNHIVDGGAILLRHALELDFGCGARAFEHEALPLPCHRRGSVGCVVLDNVDDGTVDCGAGYRRDFQGRQEVEGAVRHASAIVLYRKCLACGGRNRQRGGNQALGAISSRSRIVEVYGEQTSCLESRHLVRRGLNDLHAAAAAPATVRMLLDAFILTKLR